MVLSLILYTTIGLTVVGAGLYLTGAYNQMVSSTLEADRAFANVEVSLKQRHDELPQLVEICRGYMTHEKEVLERVVQLRSRFSSAGGVDDKVVTENELGRALSGLVARAEAYPDLKANKLFLELGDRLTEIEREIADRRELFNAAVTAFNTYIQSFPTLAIAGIFRYRARPLLQLEVSHEATPVAFGQ